MLLAAGMHCIVMVWMAHALVHVAVQYAEWCQKPGRLVRGAYLLLKVIVAALA